MTKLRETIEPVVPPIVKEVEEKEEIVSNLRANFHKKH